MGRKVQYCYRNIGKITLFQRVPKINPHFDGSNNIFADCKEYKESQTFKMCVEYLITSQTF